MAFGKAGEWAEKWLRKGNRLHNRKLPIVIESPDKLHSPLLCLKPPGLAQFDRVLASYSGWCEGPKQNFAMCVQFLVGAYEREKARNKEEVPQEIQKESKHFFYVIEAGRDHVRKYVSKGFPRVFQYTVKLSKARRFETEERAMEFIRGFFIQIASALFAPYADLEGNTTFFHPARNSSYNAFSYPLIITFAPESIITVAERLRQVQIENRPALEVIGRFDSENVFMYLDPPYVLESAVARTLILVITAHCLPPSLKFNLLHHNSSRLPLPSLLRMRI